MTSSPTSETGTGIWESDFLDGIRCVASAMCLQTPPGERDTEPGVVECRVVCMPGCLQAREVVSIVAQPMMTEGEVDPGLSVCLELTACCGEMAQVSSICWCFTVTGSRPGYG